MRGSRGHGQEDTEESDKFGEIMIDTTKLVNRPIEWQSSGTWKKEWRLYHEGDLVASLIKKKVFTDDRQAYYDGVSLEVSFDEKNDRIEFCDTDSGRTVEDIEDALRRPVSVYGKVKIIWTLKFEDGTTYSIDPQSHPSPEGTFFRDANGSTLSRIVFEPGLPLSATFTILSPQTPISPWLIAISSLYYCIIVQLRGGAF